MTTRDHLVVQLQELYAFTRDTLPLWQEMRHLAGSETLRQLLQQEMEGLRGEMETLEQGLNLLGAQYSLERSVLAAGVKETLQRVMYRWSPSQEQQDIHALLTALQWAQWAVGAYGGSIELARGIGESDVALLLAENLRRRRALAAECTTLLPHLISGVTNTESRRAA